MPNGKVTQRIHYVDDLRGRTYINARIIEQAETAIGFFGGTPDKDCKWTVYVVEPGSPADMLLARVSTWQKDK